MFSRDIDEQLPISVETGDNGNLAPNQTAGTTSTLGLESRHRFSPSAMLGTRVARPSCGRAVFPTKRCWG